MGFRLLAGARHPTPDDRLRPRGLAHGTLRLDYREVLGLDRLRWPFGERADPGRANRQPHALLATPHWRLLRAPLLGEHQAGERVDLRAHDRQGRRSHRLLDLPKGAPAPVATMGGEALPRHPILERARPGRALRRLRAAQAIR